MFYFGIIQVFFYLFTDQWEGSMLPLSNVSGWSESMYLSIKCHISSNCIYFEISYWHRNYIDALYTFSDESYFVINIFWWSKYIYVERWMLWYFVNAVNSMYKSHEFLPLSYCVWYLFDWYLETELFVNFMFSWLCISIYLCKGKQLNARFILRIFHQTLLHVSGVSTAHHQEAHRMFTAVGTYCLFIWLSVVLAVPIQPGQETAI